MNRSSKPIVVFDTSTLETPHAGRGVGSYTRHLAKALNQLNQDFVRIVTQPYRQVSGKYHLVHLPYFDLFRPTLPWWLKSKLVVTLHDLIPLDLPELFPLGLKAKLSWQYQKLVSQKIDHILTDSQASAKSIQLHLGNKTPITPTLLAAAIPNQQFSATQLKAFRQQHQLPDKYLAYVGDINFNKNLPGLIKSLGLTETKAVLAIVTRANLEADIPEAVAIKESYSQLKSTDRVLFLKLEQATDLIKFYQAAHAYIQPSLAEGFGLPVLEAMTVGTPVLAAETTSLPEVGGSAAVYFDPYQLESMAKAIDQAWSWTRAQRENYQKKSLAQAKKFSWNQTAEATLAVYKQVLFE